MKTSIWLPLQIVLALSISACSSGGSDAGNQGNTDLDQNVSENSGTDGEDAGTDDENNNDSEEGSINEVNLNSSDANDDRYSVSPFIGTEPDDSGNYYIGSVSSLTNTSDTYYEFLAGFNSFTAPPDLYELLPDECIVLNGPSSFLKFLLASSTFESESAGDVAVVTDANGTFLNVPFNEFGIYHHYDDNFLTPPPSMLTTSFSGDAIPALEIDIPDVEELVQTTDFDQAINDQTKYTWVAGSDPDAYIQIAGQTGDMPFNPDLYFSCFVVDDGEFTLSAEVVERLGGTFNSLRGSIRRVKSEFSVQNNVAIKASGASYEDYAK